MKSYLKFLSRNKLYTAVEAVGLIVSLAFVIIISCYVWQQFSVSREAADSDRCLVLSQGYDFLYALPGELSVVQDRIPDVELAARMKNIGAGVKFDGNDVQGNPDICMVDPEFFGFFPMEFTSGSAETLRDRSQVILSGSFARKISPDADPVGKSIIVGRDTCLIGGLLEIPTSSMLKERDIYRSFKDQDAPSTGDFILPVDLVLLKLKKDADIEASRTLIDTLVLKEFASFFEKNKPEHSFTMPFRKLYFSPRNDGYIVKNGNATLVRVLIAIGILLLASALFNYINLSVALAGKRAKEMAIRSTLGESRRRIVQRYITESILFVAVCLALALLLAKWLEPSFNEYVAGAIGLNVAYSWHYLVAYAVLALAVGTVSGLVPALMTSRLDTVSIIKGEQRRQTKAVFSRVFIVIQNVITVALVSLALVMELQYHHLATMPLGANVSSLYYIGSGTVGDNEFAAKPYIKRVGRANGYPGKRMISISSNKDGRKLDVGVLQCDRNAFEMFGFEIVNDYHLQDQDVVWLTETAAKALEVDIDNPSLPSALSLLFGDQEVAGIIKDFATSGPDMLNGNQIGAVYVNDMEGVATRVLELERLDKDVRTELEAIAREESLRITGDEKYMEYYGSIPELISKGMEKTHNFIRLVELFMLLATLISLLGLVAMSTYYAGLRTKDIAVRKVFGGSAMSETWRSVMEYLTLVCIAVAIGVPIAIFLAERYLRQFWYRIESYGWVFVLGAVITLCISFLAVLWQTLRAAKTDPATELKKE